MASRYLDILMKLHNKFFYIYTVLLIYMSSLSACCVQVIYNVRTKIIVCKYSDPIRAQP